MEDVWAKTKEEPKSLQNKPDLPAWLLEFFKAYLTLATRRPRSFDGGMSPIPLSDILAYIELFGTSDEETFVSYVIAMDLSLIKHVSQRQSQNAENGRRKSS